MSIIFYVTGVSGVGKSTIGIALASRLNIPFLEGDDFHPESNISKMSSGQPLNDEDRAPWLAAINHAAKREANLKGAVVSCSALKEKYRRTLSQNLDKIIWINLTLSRASIADRLKKREGHFMAADLLDSQFEAYEEPKGGVLIVNDAPTEEIIERILKAIKTR